MIVAGGRAILAGAPTYVFPPDEMGAATADSLLAVAIARDGPVSGIAVPVEVGETASSTFRAVALDGDRWAMLVGEKEPGTRIPDERIRRLWLAVFDGNALMTLSEIPMPPGWQLRSTNSSSLVRMDDGFFWAAMADRDGEQSAIVAFRQTDGAWSHEITRTYISYVEAGFSERDGLALLAVYADPALRRDGNSLFLHRPGVEPRGRRMEPTDAPPVHKPELAFRPDRYVVSWWEPASASGTASQVRAIVGRSILANDGTTWVVDRNTQRAVLVRNAGPVPLIVTDPVTDDRPAGLRVTALLPDGPRAIWEGAGSVWGVGSAVMHGDHELLIAAPQPEIVGGVPQSVVTLLIRLRVNCDPAGRGGVPG